MNGFKVSSEAQLNVKFSNFLDFFETMEDDKQED